MYEKEIEVIKQKLIYRAINAGVYDEKTTDVFHIEEGGYIYIIVNPLVTDYNADLTPFIRRNLTAWYKDGYFNDNGRYIIESGLYPILMPWLLARIEIETGDIVDGGELPRIEHDLDLKIREEINHDSFIGLDMLINGRKG